MPEIIHIGPYIIITGDPINGFTYIGPFASREEAIDYNDASQTHEGDWWIAPLLIAD